MDTKLRNRAIKASKCFLERRNYRVMDTWHEQEFCGVVAQDEDDSLVFAQVLCRLAADKGLPDESRVDRCELETLACDWLRDNKDFCDDAPARFDVISIAVLGEDQAFLRHHLNALAGI